MFDVWGAKAFAGISLEKHLPDATMSRGIVIVLRRKLPHETVSRLRHADKNLFTGIAAKLARFADDFSKQVRTARPLLPDELSDRAQDNWEPLLAIAGCAGPEWIQRATAAALQLSSASEQSVSSGNELLADIQHVFERKRVHKISTADLIQTLVADNEKSWATYNHGKPISPRQLAKLLAGYGIKSKTVRTSPTNTPKGFDTSQFEDVFARYLAAPPNMPPQRNGSPEVMTGKEGGVADKTQHAGHDPLGRVADDFQCFRDASEMLELTPTPDCGGGADEPERGPEAGTTDVF
jgi:sulfur transfer protein SufE